MSDRLRLLVVSDGAAPTGLARVTRNILSRLSPHDYDIHHLATNYWGDPHDEPWKIYAAVAGGDVYGYRRLPHIADHLRPDVIFSYNDLWIQREYLRILRQCETKARVVLYSPVEGPPVDAAWLADCDLVSKFVVFTQFPKTEVLNALGRECDERVVVIPHGVDTAAFHPLHDKDAVKMDLGLASKSGADPPFVVLNANRNQPQKRSEV
jgi:glycosyltransferase involved in cell wall biosynthesis